MLNEFFTKAIGLILSTTLIFGVLPLGTVSYDEGIDDISAETDLYTAERNERRCRRDWAGRRRRGRSDFSGSNAKGHERNA